MRRAVKKIHNVVSVPLNSDIRSDMYERGSQVTGKIMRARNPTSARALNIVLEPPSLPAPNANATADARRQGMECGCGCGGQIPCSTQTLVEFTPGSLCAAANGRRAGAGADVVRPRPFEPIPSHRRGLSRIQPFGPLLTIVFLPRAGGRAGSI